MPARETPHSPGRATRIWSKILFVMTVAELKAAIGPAVREILTAEEFRLSSVRVTSESAPLASLGDSEPLTQSTQLQVFVMGESAVIWVGGDETRDEVYTRVRSDLQDFVAESKFGWGQLRP
jgi:hypothetical protein